MSSHHLLRVSIELPSHLRQNFSEKGDRGNSDTNIYRIADNTLTGSNPKVFRNILLKVITSATAGMN
jgi:hypothetical protein